MASKKKNKMSISHFYDLLALWIKESNPNPSNDIARSAEQFFMSIGANAEEVKALRDSCEALRDLEDRLGPSHIANGEPEDARENWYDVMDMLNNTVREVIERFTGDEMQYDEVQDVLDTRDVNYPGDRAEGF